MVKKEATESTDEPFSFKYVCTAMEAMKGVAYEDLVNTKLQSQKDADREEMNEERLSYHEKRAKSALSVNYDYERSGNDYLLETDDSKPLKVNLDKITCSCKDFIFRGRKLGMACKHIIWLAKKEGVDLDGDLMERHQGLEL